MRMSIGYLEPLVSFPSFVIIIFLLKLYGTVDKTDPNAGEQGRQQAQEENQQKMSELQDKMARERDQALREAQERARCDDENQRSILDHQAREREEAERKLKDELEFWQLKDSLMNYDFQTNPRIKKEAFRDLDVGDIDLVRIALIGPTGSGKTSFVGKKNFFCLSVRTCRKGCHCPLI